MQSELERLREVLLSEEITLNQYRHNLGSGNVILEANYRHKLASVERLRAQIAALEEKDREMQADG